jgi:hypothetical protein
MNARTQIPVPAEIPVQQLHFDPVCKQIDHCVVSIMMSLGHELDLFNTLADLPPSSSVQIAEAASLVESYVKGWLSVMVVAAIISYHATDDTYELPVENSLCLTTSTAIGNFAVYDGYLEMAGIDQQQMVNSFKTGKGLSFQEFSCFHSVSTEEHEHDSPVAA